MTLLWQTNTSQTPSTPASRGDSDSVMRGGDTLDGNGVWKNANGDQQGSDGSFKSQSGVYQLTLRYGDLQLLQIVPQVPTPPVIWHTDTGGSGAERLEMKTDGNLVLSKSDQTVIAQTMTSTAGSVLDLLNDGNLAIFTS